MSNTLQENQTLTTNGMVANKSTLSKCLDLFYQSGSSREADEKEVVEMFSLAFDENPLVALKLLFHARDIRFGKGERNFFLTIIKNLAEKNPEALKKNVKLIPEFGRWKDILVLFNTHLEDVAIETIVAGLSQRETRGLCAKWIPVQGPEAVKIRRAMNIKNPKQFRKLIVGLRSEASVVEQKICSNNFEAINYSHIPSVAAKNYRKLFFAKDIERYKEYLEGLKTGKTKVNAGAVYPHEIAKPFFSLFPEEDVLIESQWKSLPNFMEDSQERIIPMIDVSGSMNGLPMEVAVSLGLYIAERNNSIFQNAFLTFSSYPEMLYITGDSLLEKFRNIIRSNWGMTTDLEAAFELILNTAVKHKLPEEEMPTTILVMSDMQFNRAGKCDETAYQMIARSFEESGYKIPKIVFWNLSPSTSNFPVTKAQQGVAMVSGFSPSILKNILKGVEPEEFTPENLMLDVVNSERYSQIEI